MIDLSLDSLLVPAITGYTPVVGKKVDYTEQNRGGLSTQQVAENIAMPFMKMRAIEVAEDADIPCIEFNAVLKATKAGITIALPENTEEQKADPALKQNVFEGCEVKVVNGSDGNCNVNAGTDYVLEPEQMLTLAYSGKWIVKELFDPNDDENSYDKGRNLVTVLGAADYKDAFAKLHAKASAGDFNDLQLGDYIDIDSMTIDGTEYSNANQRLRMVIAGFDHYYHVGGNFDVTTHHVLMICKNVVFQKRMNATDTNAGGYASSELRTFLNGKVKAGLIAAIGITPIDIDRLLDTHGSWSWYTDSVFLPTEVEVFGTKAWSDNYGFTVGSSIQYPLFSKFPQARVALLNGSRWWWWEASTDMRNTSNFCDCGGVGNAGIGDASYGIYGVRFAFCI